MDKNQQPGIVVEQIFLLSARFEHRADALSLPPSTTIELRVQTEVSVSHAEDRSRGILRVRVTTLDEGDPGPLYRFQVEMCALVRVDETAPNLSLPEYLTVQGPATMYPFLREAVANLTGRGRFGPVWLRPVNFTAMEQASEAPGGEANKSPGPESRG